ncbi:RHS repeat domain-containing protein, partial [Rhizobacter sp. P5_C2]
PNAVSVVQGTVAGLTNPGFNYEVNGNLKTGLGRSYTWTSYDMPSSIDKLDGANPVQRTAFLYGPDHARTRQTISPVNAGVAGSPTATIWYGGAVEKEVDSAANTTTIRTMLPAQLGFIEEKFSGTAIAATADTTRNLRYFLTDHLGSTLAEVDQTQSVLQRMSYDAWGRRRNADGSDDTGPQWGSLKNTQDHSGYTGHEHLDQLGLVNMNARMYDPLLGRHTSADPTVPDPANAQAFNRYSYVMNNALAFTDPSGLDPIQINTTSDSICGKRPSCAVYVAPDNGQAAQSNGSETGVAVNDGGTAKTPAPKEPSATNAGNSGTPTQSQQQQPTDLGPAIQKINRQFTDAMAAGDAAKMQELYHQYVELKANDPSSGPNIVRMGVAVMHAQGLQGNYDLSTLAPMASAALGSGMIGGGMPGPKGGSTVAGGVGKLPGPATDKAGNQIGRIIVDSKGNAMIEPNGGRTVAAGKGGVDTHTLYPNGSNYQRLNPQGHTNDPTPHGHGHALGTGPGMKGQGPSLDINGSVVPWNSSAAHWPIK